MKNKSTKHLDDQIMDLQNKKEEIADKISVLRSERRQIVPDEPKKFRFKFQMSWTTDLNENCIWWDGDGPLNPKASDVKKHIDRIMEEDFTGLYDYMNENDLHPDAVPDDKIKLDIVELNTVEV
jgi:hypothetical protein